MRTPFFHNHIEQTAEAEEICFKRNAGSVRATSRARIKAAMLERMCRDVRFVTLDEYLCEVRSNPTGGLEKLSSFEEFLVRRFPESRRNAYT
jgi:hypothetical protein